MFTSFEDFLTWERASRDTIDVKRSYVDIAGDLAAGVMLSQIIYYYLPGKDGETKLRVEKEGKKWLAKKRDDWWEECRLTPDQVDRCTSILKKAGVIETARYKFQGSPVLHIRLLRRFFQLLDEVVRTESEGGRRNPLRRMVKLTSPNGDIHLANSRIPYTETTTKTTTENHEQITSVHRTRFQLSDNGSDEADVWDNLPLWSGLGIPLHVGPVVAGGGEKTPPKKVAKRRKPRSDKQTFGPLPFEVQEKYKEIFFPKGYDMDLQRMMALGHSKKFVETALKWKFDDPVDLMGLIGKEVYELMVTRWAKGTRTPTIARLVERIYPLALQTGRG